MKSLKMFPIYVSVFCLVCVDTDRRGATACNAAPDTRKEEIVNATQDAPSSIAKREATEKPEEVPDRCIGKDCACPEGTTGVQPFCQEIELEPDRCIGEDCVCPEGMTGVQPFCQEIQPESDDVDAKSAQVETTLENLTKQVGKLDKKRKSLESDLEDHRIKISEGKNRVTVFKGATYQNLLILSNRQKLIEAKLDAAIEGQKKIQDAASRQLKEISEKLEMLSKKVNEKGKP